MAKDTKFNLTIQINGKEVANTLQGVGKELGKLNNDIKKLTPGTDDFVKKSAEIEKAREHYQSIKDEINGTNRVLEEARGHWDNVMSGFLSGNVAQAQKGLQGIVGNIKGITKAAWAFIATPFGAALATVTAVAAGVKSWVSYNLEIERTNQLVRDLTQESGNSVDLIRIRAEELADTFDVDVKESIESAKSLAKGFGISYDEAFDIIEDGAIRGKLSNGEFLDSIKEYPVQFKNAGFSASEFADIVNAGIDLSIYSDKLPDAIKEFNLAITEQTPAAREALENAFGPEFTGKLLDGLKDGSITAKDALAQISEEAENIGLNSQQAQLLTADLFKGAGEDAGGALNIFKAVNVALNDQKKPLTDIQQLQKDNLEANKELNSLQTQIFANSSKGFSMWIEKGKLFATETIIKILKGGVDLYNWFVDLNNESQVFSGALTVIGKAATIGFSVVGEALSLLWDQLKATGTIVEGIFTFDAAKIKEGFTVAVSNIGDSFDTLKKKAIDDAADIYNAFSGKDKVERFSLDDFIADSSTNGTNNSSTSGGVTGGADSGGDAEKTKQFLEERNKLFKKSEEELSALLKKQQADRLHNSQTGIDQELLAIDQKYAALKEKYSLSEADKLNLTLEQVAEREAQIQALEDEKALEKQELKIIRDAEFREQLKAIEEENRILDEEAEYERQLAATSSMEERQLLMLQRAREIANEELSIQKNKELDKVKETENSEKLKAAIREKYTKKSDKVNSEFAVAEKALKSDVVVWTELTEAQKLNAISNALNSAAAVFNQGSSAWKAIKIAETTITTYQSAVSAFNALAGIPIVGPALGGVAAGMAVATGLAQVSKISSTPLQKMPTHFYGGPTGNDAIYNDEYGAVTGVVHDDEWVGPKFMTQDPRYAPTFQWLETERKKGLGQYFDGGSAGKAAAPNFTTAAENEAPINSTDPAFMAAINRLNSNLEAGIKAYTVRDYESYIKQMEQDKEYEQIKQNTRA